MLSGPTPRQRFRAATEFREVLLRAIGEPHRGKGPLEPGEVTVGREAEIRCIEEILHMAADGRSASITFKGASGAGKSRLLAEARVRAQLQGFEVVLVNFFPELDPAPALPRALCEARAGRRRQPRWLDALAAAHGGSPEERAERAARAFFEEDGKPLLLLLDDLDRADPSSRALALALIAQAQRLADPLRDVEDLIFIDSEMAELCTLQGRFEDAEAACRRGLERLFRLSRRGEFRVRMEVDWLTPASLSCTSSRRASRNRLASTTAPRACSAVEREDSSKAWWAALPPWFAFST